jgi:pyruvate dehydrogenase E2 component (dihydrolipoamide acetyltransferase)
MATPIIMPKLGNTVEETIVSQWNIEVGDTIESGQVIAALETDKATFDFESPESGTVLAILCEEGDLVPVLENVVIVGEPGEDVSEFTANKSEAVDTSVKSGNENESVGKEVADITPDVVQVSKVDGAGISPRARGAAATKGVDITQIGGSGPGGRIIERDVLSAVAQGNVMTPLAQAVAQDTGKVAPVVGSGINGRILASDLIEAGRQATAADAVSTGDVEETELKGIRKLIAARMKESLDETAQLTLNATADAATLLATRKKLKASAELLGMPNISLGDMINYAVSRVLLRHPIMNATLEKNKLRKYSNVHLGFACNTDKGLMVPVIGNASSLSLAQLAEVTVELAGQAKSGAISPDLLQGGTFTVSNLGVLGISNFTPVLNFPQVAILGVGGIELKPVRKDGEVVFEDHIALSLTIDHQVVDGWDAGLFLKDLCEAIKNFDMLVLQ